MGQNANQGKVGAGVTPLVSVVIATYNRRALLTDAIESVRAQTYSHWELIIADDGSTDTTIDYLSSLDDPKIRYLSLPHTGNQSIPRNQAAAAANGDIVTFLDDDDQWAPEKLERQVARFTDEPAAQFVYTDSRFLYEDGSQSPPVLRPAEKQNGWIFTSLLHGCFIGITTVAVRRSFFESIGGFDETLLSVEVYEWLLRLSHTGRVAYIDEPLVLLRRHRDQMSSEREVITYEEMIDLLPALSERYSMNLRQRWIARCTLARCHTKLARLHRAVGKQQAARRHLFRAFLLNPMQRFWWGSVVRWLTAPQPPVRP